MLPAGRRVARRPRIIRDATMSAHEQIRDAAQEHALGAAAAKAAPPVAVSGAMIAGVQMADIVLWLTMVYLVIQIGYLGWKWISEWRESSRAEERRNENHGHNPERRKRK